MADLDYIEKKFNNYFGDTDAFLNSSNLSINKILNTLKYYPLATTDPENSNMKDVQLPNIGNINPYVLFGNFLDEDYEEKKSLSITKLLSPNSVELNDIKNSIGDNYSYNLYLEKVLNIINSYLESLVNSLNIEDPVPVKPYKKNIAAYILSFAEDGIISEDKKRNPEFNTKHLFNYLYHPKIAYEKSDKSFNTLSEPNKVFVNKLATIKNNQSWINRNSDWNSDSMKNLSELIFSTPSTEHNGFSSDRSCYENSCLIKYENNNDAILNELDDSLLMTILNYNFNFINSDILNRDLEDFAIRIYNNYIGYIAEFLTSIFPRINYALKSLFDIYLKIVFDENNDNDEVVVMQARINNIISQLDKLLDYFYEDRLISYDSIIFNKGFFDAYNELLNEVMADGFDLRSASNLRKLEFVYLLTLTLETEETETESEENDSETEELSTKDILKNRLDNFYKDANRLYKNFEILSNNLNDGRFTYIKLKEITI